MSLLDPRRLDELVLPYCLLSCARQRAPVYLLFTTCRSLNCHAVPALAASFLASFEALGERKDASNAWWGSTKVQTAPEGSRMLCRAPRPTTEIPHVLASGYHRIIFWWTTTLKPSTTPSLQTQITARAPLLQDGALTVAGLDRGLCSFGFVLIPPSGEWETLRCRHAPMGGFLLQPRK